jgi:transposase
MAKPLSEDLRSRVIEAVQGGMSRRATAARFSVSPTSVVRWIGAWRSSGQVGPKPMGGDRRSGRVEALGGTILDAVKAQVDLTLAELAALLHERHEARVASSSVWRFLDRHAITIKKNRACRRTSSARCRRRTRGLACHAIRF